MKEAEKNCQRGEKHQPESEKTDTEETFVILAF